MRERAEIEAEAKAMANINKEIETKAGALRIQDKKWEIILPGIAVCMNLVDIILKQKERK